MLTMVKMKVKVVLTKCSGLLTKILSSANPPLPSYCLLAIVLVYRIQHGQSV
jgi:hypothetical protein